MSSLKLENFVKMYFFRVRSQCGRRRVVCGALHHQTALPASRPTPPPPSHPHPPPSTGLRVGFCPYDRPTWKPRSCYWRGLVAVIRFSKVSFTPWKVNLFKRSSDHLGVCVGEGNCKRTSLSDGHPIACFKIPTILFKDHLGGGYRRDSQRFMVYASLIYICERL